VSTEQAIDATGPRASEAQFHIWSSDVTEENNDVRWITTQLQPDPSLRVLDVGGGNGKFAAILANWAHCRVDVLDPSSIAAEHFTKSPRCALIRGDFNNWRSESGEQYDLIIFRVVLHHLIGQGNQGTERNQKAALAKAASMLTKRGRIYILENVYEPYVGDDLSARLIYEATSLRGPATIFRKLGANTAGEGVRFHSLSAWRRMFAESGLTVESESFDHAWALPFRAWQRLPFLCARRYQWLSLSRPAGASNP
jgi:SAM-dependent methyltransferase